MNIQDLIRQYIIYLEKEISYKSVGEYYEITTPYLDNANDCIQVYIKPARSTVYFSDDGATLARLKMAGVQLGLDQETRIKRTLERLGTNLNGDELVADCPTYAFASKMQLFIQSILNVEAMFRDNRPEEE